jgi:hypothetical protein
VEAEEGDGEDDAAVFVDVAGLHPEKALRRSRRYGGGIRRGKICRSESYKKTTQVNLQCANFT